MPEISTPLIAPLLAFLGFTTLILRHLLQTAGRTRARIPDHLSNAAHIFEFEHGQLVGASPAALKALSPADLSDDAYAELLEKLSRIFPDIEAQIELAVAAEHAAELSTVTEQGPVEVRIETSGTGKRVCVTGLAAPFADMKLVDRRAIEHQETTFRTLQEVSDIAPVPTWRETAQGEIDWVNPAYRKLLSESALEGSDTDWPPVRLFQSASITSPGAKPRPRRSALNLADGTARVYEVVSMGHKDRSVHFAIDASATALAEDSLRNFAQTLTQTFAELPVGLAIFDSGRRMVMFNPALMDLTSLKPEWLSAKPTLYDFLNELREHRMVPERKDFRNWRDDLVQLERSAEKGTYLETWTLSGGQIYRVTGRPHPQGAIAIFFEDITSEIALTRKIRAEKKLQDDMLDAISDAVIAFDAHGNLRAANQRFSEYWTMDPCAEENPPHIHDIVKLWQSQSHPSPTWGDIRDFVFQSSERAEWAGTVIHRDGRVLTVQVKPIAGLTTMVSFSDADTDLMPVAEAEPQISHASTG